MGRKTRIAETISQVVQRNDLPFTVVVALKGAGAILADAVEQADKLRALDTKGFPEEVQAVVAEAIEALDGRGPAMLRDEAA